MLRRLFLLLVAAVSCALASAAPVGAASTTIAEAVPGVYDAPVTTRGAIQGLGDLTNASSQPAGSQERSAARSVTTQGQSTTPHSRSVATNTVDDFSAIKPGSAGGPTAGKPFSPSVREATLADNPSTCVYCRMETSAPQVDHAIPRVQGGNATIENAQTTCTWCNPSKGGRTVPVNPPPDYVGPWPPPWWSTP